MRRSILDAAVGRLEIHIHDPLVQNFAKGAEQDDGVLAGIVVVAFQNITECRAGIAVHQIVIQVPWNRSILPLYQGTRTFAY